MEADKLILNTDIDGLDPETYLYDIYRAMLTNQTTLLSLGTLKATEPLKKETRLDGTFNKGNKAGYILSTSGGLGDSKSLEINIITKDSSSKMKYEKMSDAH